MYDFNLVFPNFTDGIRSFMEAVLPVSVVLCFGAVLQAGRHAQKGNWGMMMQILVGTGVIAAVIWFLPSWSSQIQTAVHNVVIDDLGHDPTATHKRFAELLEVNKLEGEDSSWWRKITHPEDAIIPYLLQACLWLVGFIAMIIEWWARMFQEAARQFAVALGPLLLPLWLYNSTRGIMIHYVMGLVGLMCWPLGWGLAGIMTEGLLQAATDGTVKMLPAGNDIFNVQAALFVAFAGVWVLFSTLIAPAAISKAVATGAQVGSALLGGTATAATAATVAGARGAAAVSTMGSSPPPPPGNQSIPGSAAGGMAGASGMGGGSIAGASDRASKLTASS
jgi:type IV secretion system protein TrbL